MAGEGLPRWHSSQLDAQLGAGKTSRPCQLLPSHSSPGCSQNPLRQLCSELPFGEICLSSPSLEAARRVGRLIYPMKATPRSGCRNLFPDIPLDFLNFTADSTACPTQPLHGGWVRSTIPPGSVCPCRRGGDEPTMAEHLPLLLSQHRGHTKCGGLGLPKSAVLS